MTERERLIELLSIAVGDCNLTDSEIRIVADYLLANGVIVPPVKVGQTVWCLYGYMRFPQKVEISRVTTSKYGVDFSGYTKNGTVRNFNEGEIGYVCFLTQEEAEIELERRKNETN